MTIPNIGSLWYTNVDLPTIKRGEPEPVNPYIMAGNIFTVLETPHVPGTPRYVKVLFKEGTTWLIDRWFDTRSRCITNISTGNNHA